MKTAILIVIGIVIFLFYTGNLHFIESNDSIGTEIAQKQPPKEPNPIKDRIEYLQPKIDPVISESISKSISNYCEKYKLSVNLVLHLMFRESSFNPMSTSKSGAKGLMQIMDRVHKKEIEELKSFKSYDIYHIDKNIKIGCIILRKYIDKNKTLDGALKNYVGGNNKAYMNDIYKLMADWSIQKSI